MKRLFLTFGLLACLISAAVLIWAQFKTPAVPSVTQPLAELITTGEEFGWSHEDLPLGPTEAIAESSQERLNLSDFLYRRYSRGPDSFDLYLGYWEPGAQSLREVSVHVPDTCWITAGWKFEEKSEKFRAKTRNLETIEGNFRWFSLSRNRINVAFWHLVDGRPTKVTDTNPFKRGLEFLKKPFVYQLNVRREQFLIRISSSKPLDNYWDTPLMQQILQDLAFTGLVPKERL